MRYACIILLLKNNKTSSSVLSIVTDNSYIYWLSPSRSVVKFLDLSSSTYAVDDITLSPEIVNQDKHGVRKYTQSFFLVSPIPVRSLSQFLWNFTAFLQYWVTVTDSLQVLPVEFHPMFLSSLILQRFLEASWASTWPVSMLLNTTGSLPRYVFKKQIQI